MKRYLLCIILLALVLFGFVFFGFRYFKDKMNVSLNKENTTEMSQELDPNKLPKDIIIPLSLEDTVKNILSEKLDTDVSSLRVEVIQSKGAFARGIFFIEGDSTEYLFLTQSIDENNWKLLFEGSSNVDCSIVDSVSFPPEIMPECWDGQILKNRLPL